MKCPAGQRRLRQNVSSGPCYVKPLGGWGVAFAGKTAHERTCPSVCQFPHRFRR
ncbi:hypothetical protein NY78_0518 [Desulfovibrio sp. TomC]|nr:hypothetical protein NY78_0518 [Desulfovibrio sp. TomC]